MTAQANTTAIATAADTALYTRANKDGSIKTMKVRGLNVAVRRTDVGILTSGNKAEKMDAAGALFATRWINGQFKPLSVELVRVFNAAIVPFADNIGLDLDTGKLGEGALVGLTNRSAWEAIFNGLRKAHAAKPFKGEKALYLDMIESARAQYAARQSEADAARAAAQVEAGLTADDARTVDTTAREAEPARIEA